MVELIYTCRKLFAHAGEAYVPVVDELFGQLMQKKKKKEKKNNNKKKSPKFIRSKT